MTTANPPYPNYDGIPYNSAYFSPISTSLSQTTADTRYLIKSSADTATALETFSSGIQVGTAGLDTSTTLGTLSLGTTNAANISIGKNAVAAFTNGPIVLIPAVIATNTTINGNTTLGGNITIGSTINGAHSLSGTTTLSSSATIFESGGLAVAGATSVFTLISGNAGNNTTTGVYKPVSKSVAKNHYVYTYCQFATYIYLDSIGVNGQTITVFNNNTSNRACWLYVQYGDTAVATPSVGFLWSPPTVAGGSVFNYTGNATAQFIQVPLYGCLTFTYFDTGIATTGGFSKMWVRTG